MDINDIKDKILTNVYYISSDKKVPLHKHTEHDELFYCIKGEGFGVLESSEEKLVKGKVFNVPADTMHALRSESELFVTSFLIPVIRGKITVEDKDKKKDEGKDNKQKDEKEKGQDSEDKQEKSKENEDNKQES